VDGRFRGPWDGNEHGVRVLFWLYTALPAAAVVSYAAVGLASG
jgi:hypothetical protein